MKKLYYIYKENIYGVMGTLVFHILLIGSLLLADMTVKGESEHSFVSIEMGKDLLIGQEPEDNITLQTETQQNEISTNLSSPETFSSTSVSNQAVNDAATSNVRRSSKTDTFFDEEYQRELEEAQRLASNVNKQLAKDIPTKNDYIFDESSSGDQSGSSLNQGGSSSNRSSSGSNRFEMPEQTTDGMNPEEISNTVYSGKSNIHYSLENRYHRRLPIPVYLAQGGGKITINIWVSKEGRVTKTEVQSSSAITDPMITEYALQAASRTVFNSDETAPNPQRGTITYTFVAQ